MILFADKNIKLLLTVQELWPFSLTDHWLDDIAYSKSQHNNKIEKLV